MNKKTPGAITNSATFKLSLPGHRRCSRNQHHQKRRRRLAEPEKAVRSSLRARWRARRRTTPLTCSAVEDRRGHIAHGDRVLGQKIHARPFFVPRLYRGPEGRGSSGRSERAERRAKVRPVEPLCPRRRSTRDAETRRVTHRRGAGFAPSWTHDHSVDAVRIGSRRPGEAVEDPQRDGCAGGLSRNRYRARPPEAFSHRGHEARPATELRRPRLVIRDRSVVPRTPSFPVTPAVPTVPPDPEEACAMSDLRLLYQTRLSRGRIVRWIARGGGQSLRDRSSRLCRQWARPTKSRREFRWSRCRPSARRHQPSPGMRRNLAASRRGLPEAGLTSLAWHGERGAFLRWMFFGAGPVGGRGDQPLLRPGPRARHKRKRGSAMALPPGFSTRWRRWSPPAPTCWASGSAQSTSISAARSPGACNSERWRPAPASRIMSDASCPAPPRRAPAQGTTR